MDLTTLTLSQASQLISARKLSPLELTRACLYQIERLDPVIKAFITLTAELALEQARRSGDELDHGEYRSPLQGIPLVLKDLFETKGVRTTAGSTFLAGNVPMEDAAVVEKLRAVGAVFLGKSNMHEVALGVTNLNPHYGTCRNPWDTERMTGGSSGGSAAALSAGMCLGALGSDTGGSIRIPCSLCGTVGLKPTYGLVSLRGVIPLSWNLDHAGPMARTVKDAALLLSVMAGYDPKDPASKPAPDDDYLSNIGRGVKDWRVAMAEGSFIERSDPEVLRAFHSAAQVFASLGAQVEAIEMSWLREAAGANGVMTTADAAAYHRERMVDNPQVFGADVLQRLQTGAAYSSTEYALARRAQTETRRRLELFFEDYDVLLTPTTAIPASLIQGTDSVAQASRLTGFTAPFNLSGLPALSLPCGFTEMGLPIGLQIVSRPWGEAKVLQAGQSYESATEWHTHRPTLMAV
jgi:aspartyl-tRNA(Asn)/glutamyl-tRNA(Gln) amidotransferase subunit A